MQEGGASAEQKIQSQPPMDAEANRSNPDESSRCKESNGQECGEEGSFPIHKKKRSNVDTRLFDATRIIEYR